MKNERRKAIKKIIALVMVILMGITITSCRTSTNYDEKILELGKQTLDQLEIIQGRTYGVSFENGIYTVDINGDIRKIEIADKKENKKDSIKCIDIKLSKTSKELIESSFLLVKDYIANSTVLKDKETIMQELDKIEVKIAEYDEVAEYRDGTLYIGKDYVNVICEWMICHELMHALADITNGGVENEPYAYYQFNEGLTDFITYTLNPQIPEGYVSGYSQYYYYISLYIGCFEEKAIQAYFYGYDELWEKVGKDEFDFFVFSFENMEKDKLGIVCINNFFNKWGARN